MSILYKIYSIKNYFYNLFINQFLFIDKNDNVTTAHLVTYWAQIATVLRIQKGSHQKNIKNLSMING